ncbi:DMT family transporter [Pelagibius sp. Alg239-R121]|uniref:DMT family transporter n=1 Tax=Pelagibius sp. Alg239-R121 TaxID=2993448 RepID=UPI0024A750DF|nr:DMT family transporter [Pelagibius sp. Alg239-R121]
MTTFSSLEISSNRTHNQHLIGILLVVASAVVFSLAGVLTKMIESDAWTIACWRGLFGALFITLYVLWRERGRKFSDIFSLGWRGWLLATIGSLSTLAFINAFKLTYVANVAIIYATAPFIAAALEWMLRGVGVRPSTMIAAIASLLGVAIMAGAGAATGSITGDALALVMTLGMSLYMVLIRVFTDTPVVLAAAASAFQLFVLGWFITEPLAVSSNDAVLLVLFGVVFAVASVLLTEGTRMIPASESGLLGSAETPLAVLFAWLILAELPPSASLIGGAIVMLAVIGHAARDFVGAAR